MCDCSKSSFGERVGGKIGRSVQNRVMNLPFAKKAKNWFGNGDYTVKMNSIITGAGGDTDNLKLLTHGSAYQELTYREYLGDVYSGGGPALATGDQNSIFNIQTWAVNPGILNLHPWLAPIAQQYEQWEPMGYVFEFQSKLTDFSTTQNLGSIIMASDYDVLDPPYQSKTEMLNAQFSSEAKPTENLLHGLECDPHQRPTQMFYIRSGAVSGDLREYDLCNFNLATINIPLKAAAGVVPSPLNLGSLYVHYTIRLYKPQLSNGYQQKGDLQALYYCTDLVRGQAFTATSFVTANPYGASAGLPKKTFDSIGLTFSIAASGNRSAIITFPASIQDGYWLFHYELRGSNTNSVGWWDSFVPVSNCESAKQGFNQNNTSNGYFFTPSSENDSSLQISAPGTAFIGTAVIRITGPSAKINFGPRTDFSPVGMATLENFFVYVTQVNNFSVV